MKVIDNYNGFVTDSLQNTFYVPQKKAFKWHEGEQMMTEFFIFWVNYSFKVFFYYYY